MITRKYSKINALNLIPFVYDILKANKTEELLSFLMWEFSWHFLKKKIKQIQFNNTVSDIMIEGGIKNLKTVMNTKFHECSTDFNLVIIDGQNMILGSRVSYPTKLFSQDKDGGIMERFDFGTAIKCIFKDKRNNIFVCSNGEVFKSEDSGLTFKSVLKFSSDESLFLFETVTETDNNEILIGEYANIKNDGKWVFVGYLYISNDEGETWQKSDFLKHKINKHIHIIKWVKQLKCLILTEGDDKKGIWMNKSNNYFSQSNNEKSGWFRLNKFHIQKGGYTGFVETAKNIVLGTDYYQGTNFIVSTTDVKNFDFLMIPDPYRRSAVFRMVYLENQTIWAGLYNHLHPNKSLLMYSEDFGKSWYKFLEYDGSQIKISMISNAIGNHLYVLAEDLISNEFKTYLVSHQRVV